MAYIPPEKISEIQNATEIVDVISEYIPLQSAGKNYKALCPFHDENTPSFIISPDKQLYNCFGCQEGGNVFHFLMNIDRVSFPEAVKILAERAGIPLEVESEREKGGVYDLYKIQRMAARFYYKNLNHPKHSYARDYLEEREISDESREKFGLGLALPGWENFLTYGKEEHSFSEEEMEKAGLIIESSKNKGGYYDRFRKRLMFPIFDGQHRVVGFGGRAFGDDQPKYLNSPESDIFNKSRLLYGLSHARDEIIDRGQVAIVEGYTDVIMAHQFGFPWVVATLGTSFTSQHARMMKRMAKEVFLIFDGDEAGSKASLRSIAVLLQEELEVRVVPLEEGYDPCDFLLDRGKRALEDQLDKSIGFLDFFLASLRENYDLKSLSEKSRALEEVLPILQRIKNPIIQDGMLQRMAQEFSLSTRALYKKMEEGGSRRRSAPRSKKKKREEKKKAPTREKLLLEEKIIMEVMLQKPELIPRVLEEMPPENFQSQKLSQVAHHLQEALEKEEEITAPLEMIPDADLQQFIARYFLHREDHQKRCDMEVVRDCLASLGEREMEREIGVIKSEIERSGKAKDFERQRELLQEYSNLKIELQKLKASRRGRLLKF